MQIVAARSPGIEKGKGVPDRRQTLPQRLKPYLMRGNAFHGFEEYAGAEARRYFAAYGTTEVVP
uniref:Uncharacterized protein n=1 Tax=Paracidobacterium acidisoli TaxID=2303751 RepID=A0A372IL93_9BACT